MRTIEQLASGFMATLAKSGLVRVSGEDAITFIHGQISNDVANLKVSEARFAGYCTPDGRLLATLLVWKSQGDVWLLVPRDILPQLIKRLQIYILRSKVNITDVTSSFIVTGLGGKKAPDAIAPVFPEMPAYPYAKAQSHAGVLIRISDAFGSARFLWIAPPETTYPIEATLSLALMATEDEDWELGDIEAGMPQVYATTQNMFVPQMMNMELVGGVSFTKGCYPGQGIVAHLQHHDTPKQRMIPAHIKVSGHASASASGVEPGRDIFDAFSPDAPCGMVVRAARRNEKRIDCLMVILRGAATLTSLRLGAPDGPKLYPDSLPYALPDESGVP
jgi:folate-binding protein YgfZ